MSILVDEETGPIRIITPDDVSNYLERNKEAALQNSNVIVSPLSDESVRGHNDDKVPNSNGLQEIKTVVDMLHEAEVSCCFVAEPALIYYGVGRVMTVFTKLCPQLIQDYCRLINIESGQ